MPLPGDRLILAAGLAAVLILALAILRRLRLSRLARGLAPWQPEEGRSGLWEENGHRIRYFISGQGPRLVCFHGMGASSFSFRALIPYLTSHFEVLLVDLPGFGDSHWPRDRAMTLENLTEVVNEFLKELSPKSSYLCGSSLGGTLALELAKCDPKHFPKVVVMAPASSPRFILPLSWMSSMSWLLQWLVQPESLAWTLKYVRAGRWPSREDRDSYLRPYLLNPTSFSSLFAATKILRDKSLPRRFSSLSSPVLVLWGARDRIVPRRLMRTLMENLPHARFEEHPQAGHHPHEDNPEWTAEKIRIFLSEN